MANELVAKLKNFPKNIPLPKWELSEERKKTLWIWIVVLILGGAIVGADVLLFHSASQTADTMDAYQTETVKELQALLENLTKIDNAITSSQEMITSSQEMIGNSQEMITNSENSTNSSVEELATHLTTLHEDIFTTETDIQTLLSSISEKELSSYEEYLTKFSSIEEQVTTLDATFQNIIEETQLKITELNSNSDSRTDTLIETLTTLETTLSTQEKSLNTDVLNTLSILKETLTAQGLEQNTEVLTTLDTVKESLTLQGKEQNTEVLTTLDTVKESLTVQGREQNTEVLTTLDTVKESLTEQGKEQNTEVLNTLGTMQENSEKQLTDVQNDLRGELDTKFDANSQELQNFNTSVTNQFSVLSESNQASMEALTQSLIAENAELKAEIQSVYNYIDRSFTSVADGKKLVASALATKNKPVANDATFREIYTAILGIPQTVQAGGMAGSVVTTYHHHTLGVRGNADNNNSTPGSYTDSYHSSVCSGCFTTPVYHEHTDACYHTEYHEGIFEWDGFASDEDENGNPVGNWSAGGWVQCQYCSADTYHIERGHGSLDGGSTTVSWETEEMICGKEEGELEYYKKSCPLTEGQPVKSIVTYYRY